MRALRSRILPLTCSAGLLCGVLGIISAQGCSALRSLVSSGSTVPQAGVQNPVVDIFCIWQVGDGHDPAGEPCRGFCGQLMFVSMSSPTAARVDGSVQIEVYDALAAESESATPFDVFEFSREEWATFAHETKLGMTYQLFVPYRRSGRGDADCALRVRYSPHGGGTPISSDFTPISLPGKPLSARGAAEARQRARALAADAGRGPSNRASDAAPGPVSPASPAAAAVDAAELSSSAPSIARLGGTPSAPSVARLQQVLDQSMRETAARNSGGVHQADYVGEPPRGGIEHADYTTDPEGW